MFVQSTNSVVTRGLS